MYKMLSATAILKVDTGESFGIDPDSRHYQAYLTWVAQGNVPQPADPVVLSLGDKLASSDLDMARICEDLIVTLLPLVPALKAALPPAVLTKINARRAIRGQVAI